MAEQNLLTEQDVLRQIGAQDFRSIKKEQLIEFVSSIPNMPKEVAIKCIEQFPEFRQSATEMIGQLSNMCESLIADNKDSRDKAIMSYQVILEEMRLYLEAHPRLRHKKRQEITDKMIEVADRIATINDKNMEHQKGLLRTVASVAAFALAVGGAILGVNFIKKS